MDNFFDTPAVDLLDYGQDDNMGNHAYYWQVEDEDGYESCAPAYFA